MIAKLAQQTIFAYQKEYHLESGIMVEADIILGKRSLLRWILAPIYNFGKKL